MAKGPIKRGRKPAASRPAEVVQAPAPPAAAKLDTLDMSRSYGTVTGKMVVLDANGVERTVAFEQKARGGSRIYDHNKVRILRPGEQPAAFRPAPSVREEPVAPAAPNLDDDDEDDTPAMVLPGDDEADAVFDDDDVNLTAWAERRVNYRWAQVRDAIEQRYGRTINEPDEARDFLAEQGIGRVSARNASPELRAEE